MKIWNGTVIRRNFIMVINKTGYRYIPIDENEELPELSQVQVGEIATNVQNMINQYFTVSNLHLRCPIHMLQLAIKDTIYSISSPIP